MLALLFVGLASGTSVAQSAAFDSDSKARLASTDKNIIDASLNFEPLRLDGGSKITVISPLGWSNIADSLKGSVERTHREFTQLFGEIPAFKTSLRLIDEESFFLITGAPKWTNAMYYRGQIIIPLPSNENVDTANLERSLRHEYTHAVVHALSNGKCPGWLDEGLAQWSEGTENPALRPALLRWLKSNPPVPLNLLQGGFTKLETSMVPAAYAQSLYATNSVINNHGFLQLRSYFDRLREGASKSEAFINNFKLSESSFEQRLGSTLRSWRKKHGKHHRR